MAHATVCCVVGTADGRRWVQGETECDSQGHFSVSYQLGEIDNFERESPYSVIFVSGGHETQVSVTRSR